MIYIEVICSRIHYFHHNGHLSGKLEYMFRTQLAHIHKYSIDLWTTTLDILNFLTYESDKRDRSHNRVVNIKAT